MFLKMILGKFIENPNLFIARFRFCIIFILENQEIDDQKYLVQKENFELFEI